MSQQNANLPPKSPEISIVVPVYRVEKYLNSCIDSLLAQTFADFEVILVDDGSPDACPALCDAAAAKDGRIRVIHQANKGLSGARNAGLDAAKGAWIGFVDSDDYIAPEMYEVLYQAVQSTGADLALCDYAEVDETGAPCQSMHIRLEKKDFTGRDLLKNATDSTIQPAWNKLVNFAAFASASYTSFSTRQSQYRCAASAASKWRSVLLPLIMLPPRCT